MKRLILLLTLLLVLPLTALADTAQDISPECVYNGRAYNEAKPDELRDDNYKTVYRGKRVTIQAPQDKKISTLFVRWQVVPKTDIVLSSGSGEKWKEFQRSTTTYAQQLIFLDEPQESIRINLKSGQLEIIELIVFTEGEIPAEIPQWREPKEKVDLMLFSTHPDDEVLWFGGLLPYYAGEMGKEVLVINAVFNTFLRMQELLDSLWTCGVETYPVFCRYADIARGTQAQIKKKWRGWRYDPDNGPIELIRQYKPDVVVTHDINGEYGHPAHILFSTLARNGVEGAAQADKHKASYELYGTWDVPKTYVHLYGENQIRMDWKQPLSAFGGKTGLEVAEEGLNCHKSQMDENAAWFMSDTDGGQYDNALFGLWRTSVGPDVLKNDMFENIPAR